MHPDSIPSPSSPQCSRLPGGLAGDGNGPPLKDDPRGLLLCSCPEIAWLSRSFCPPPPWVLKQKPQIGRNQELGLQRDCRVARDDVDINPQQSNKCSVKSITHRLTSAKMPSKQSFAEPSVPAKAAAETSESLLPSPGVQLNSPATTSIRRLVGLGSSLHPACCLIGSGPWPECGGWPLLGQKQKALPS